MFAFCEVLEPTEWGWWQFTVKAHSRSIQYLQNTEYEEKCKVLQVEESNIWCRPKKAIFLLSRIVNARSYCVVRLLFHSNMSWAPKLGRFKEFAKTEHTFLLHRGWRLLFSSLRHTVETFYQLKWWCLSYSFRWLCRLLSGCSVFSPKHLIWRG